MTGLVSKSDGTGYAGIRGLKGTVYCFNIWSLLF